VSEPGSPALRLERCVRRGGVALFPSDTVYGLACSPEQAAAVQRLYRIKGRPAQKAAAIMFFSLDAALRLLPELGPRTRAALQALLPGPVTLLVGNPRGRWPLASAGDPTTLGLRVVSVPGLEGVQVPVLQSSANRSGDPEARRLEDVDPRVRAGVDLSIDGGELPGVASTVVDLRGYEAGGSWAIRRLGALGEEELAALLGGAGGGGGGG
jgi:L-threonylcarbamoyladenylate synthase